jgi:hypothetical protein
MARPAGKTADYSAIQIASQEGKKNEVIPKNEVIRAVQS